MCVLMTSSCPKCGGGQVFAVGLEEGEVGCGGAEIGGGAESGGTCIQIFIHLFKCFTHTYMYTHTLTHIHTHTHIHTYTHKQPSPSSYFRFWRRSMVLGKAGSGGHLQNMAGEG